GYGSTTALLSQLSDPDFACVFLLTGARVSTMLRAIQSYILYDLKRIYVRVDADTARSLVIGLLRQRKASQDNARSQADLLIEAELRGHPSHGLQRLPRLL